MNQLRLTQKVQKAGGIKPVDLSEIDENGITLGSWTVNLFIQDRKKVLVFLNDLTLYSFVLTGARKEHYKDLRERFCFGLIQLLEIDGFTQKQAEYLVQGCDSLTYSKTHSKKVLGNMNDIIWHYQHIISSDGGLEYADIGHAINRVNRMPQRNIDWRYSVDAVSEIAKNA